MHAQRRDRRPDLLLEVGPMHPLEGRTRLEQTVPTGDDGTISLTARAWAVKGLRRWPLKSGVA